MDKDTLVGRKTAHLNKKIQSSSSHLMLMVSSEASQHKHCESVLQLSTTTDEAGRLF